MDAYLERCFEFLNKCCKWGIKKRVRFTERFNGFTAPIWHNAYPRFSLLTAILSFLLFAVFLLLYIFLLADKPNCSWGLKQLNLVQVIFLGVNSNLLSSTTITM